LKSIEVREIEIDESINEEKQPDWSEIDFSIDEVSSQYVTITPEVVALLSLSDCRDQLVGSVTQPRKLLLAAKSAHLSLQSALTAALAGSANIGAHPEKLRSKYLQVLNSDLSDLTKYPESMYVMDFKDLLETALEAPLPWTGEAIVISDEIKQLLFNLMEIRHAIEHVKQTDRVMHKVDLLNAIGPAIRLTIELLQTVFHHFEEGEIEEINGASAQIFLLLNSRI
jgi:hypothetical protein